MQVMSPSRGLQGRATQFSSPGIARVVFVRMVLPALACTTLLSGCIDVNVPDQAHS